MTKIRISNHQNQFFKRNVLNLGTTEIRICFEFRASIFEIRSLLSLHPEGFNRRPFSADQIPYKSFDMLGRNIHASEPSNDAHH